MRIREHHEVFKEMKHQISVVINYCTNDYQFIRHTVKAVAPFASEIIIPVSDHFYDGSPENYSLLKKTKRENSEATFIDLEFDPTLKEQHIWWWKLRRILRLSVQSGSQFWICYARYRGYSSVSNKRGYVLFLDADEVIDTKRFIHWLNGRQYKNLYGMKFANYWYFRRPIYQATTIEDSPVMVRNGTLSYDSFFSYSERQGIYEKLEPPKKRMILGLDGMPMVHHFGWVRSKKNMLKKVRTWGHNREVDWKTLVEKEFTHEFNGKDFVQGYSFRTVKPFISFPDR